MDLPNYIERDHARWAEEERAVRLYEDPGCFGLSVASAEELTDRTPEKWERELDRIERLTDEGRYDEDGVSYP